MTFAELGLNPAILSAITACGYTTPTPIQEQSIPLVLAGNDVIATAQTGTGKGARGLALHIAAQQTHGTGSGVVNTRNQVEIGRAHV